MRKAGRRLAFLALYPVRFFRIQALLHFLVNA